MYENKNNVTTEMVNMNEHYLQGSIYGYIVHCKILCSQELGPVDMFKSAYKRLD